MENRRKNFRSGGVQRTGPSTYWPAVGLQGLLGKSVIFLQKNLKIWKIGGKTSVRGGYNGLGPIDRHYEPQNALQWPEPPPPQQSGPLDLNWTRHKKGKKNSQKKYKGTTETSSHKLPQYQAQQHASLQPKLEPVMVLVVKVPKEIENKQNSENDKNKSTCLVAAIASAHPWFHMQT